MLTSSPCIIRSFQQKSSFNPVMSQVLIAVSLCCLFYQGSAHQLQYSHSPTYDFLQYIAKTIDNKFHGDVVSTEDRTGELETPYVSTRDHDMDKRQYEMLSDPCAEDVRHERLFNLQNKKGEPREFAPDFRVYIYTCRNSGSSCAGLQAPPAVREIRKTVCKERMGWILARVGNPNDKSNAFTYEMVGPVPRGCFCGIRTA
ncbi:uncharacterized protein LOC129257227 [Lytechinus pictus]|uniref:uncharacterized protein LOC129257227 n=1 Tax=Lytechinus pictus TaxID=7653 RepID=UPI0030B9FB7F